MGEIAPLQRRLVETAADETYSEIGIRSFGKGVFHKAPTSGLQIGSKRVFAVEPGDLLFNIVFAWEGAVAVASEAERGMIGSHRFLTCVVDPAKADPRFLNYWFSNREGRDQLLAASPGGAGRNRTLGVEKLAAIEVSLPPLDEQRRIVARIEALASKVSEARQLRADAMKGAKRLLSAMAHRSDLNVDQKLLEDWRPVRLRDVLTEYGDPHAVRADQSYPNFGIYSFGRGLFSKPPISGLETSASRLYRAKAGLFIYSRLFAFEGAYGVVNEDFDGFFVSNEYPMFECDRTRILPEFLAAYVLPPSIWKRIAEGSVGLGDRRQRVQPSQLLNLEVLLPPIEWQHSIRTVWEKLSAALAVQTETAAELDAIMPAILDRAFKGEL
jgi:type I restriction enzyme, S subunit